MTVGHVVKIGSHSIIKVMLSVVKRMVTAVKQLIIYYLARVVYNVEFDA
jgi:hypothetical protein